MTRSRLQLPAVRVAADRLGGWEHPYSPVVRFGQPVHLQVLQPVPANQAVDKRRGIERRMKQIALGATPPPRRYEPDRDGWWDGYRYEIDTDFPELAGRVEQRRTLIAARR
jgi:1-acyl-sn-glycerol-3-phosphate acyltransferase